MAKTIHSIVALIAAVLLITAVVWLYPTANGRPDIYPVVGSSYDPYEHLAEGNGVYTVEVVENYKPSGSDCWHLPKEPPKSVCPNGWSTDFDHVRWDGSGCDGDKCSTIKHEPGPTTQRTITEYYLAKDCKKVKDGFCPDERRRYFSS
jgi:hypothetical protein